METHDLKTQINQLLAAIETDFFQEQTLPPGMQAELFPNPPKEQPQMMAEKKHSVSLKWLVPLGIGTVVVSLLVVLLVLPAFQESATIFIRPDRQTITASGEVTVSARLLLTKSLSLSEEVNTTGTAHQNATHAHGLLTFYNALQSPQMVPGGTVLIGNDAIHVVTDTDALLPAGNLATNGQVTVSAHTTLVGAVGNIAAGDINGQCCRENMFVRNTQFIGGQDARDYKTATNADSKHAISEMALFTANQLAAAAAKKNLTSQEALLPPQCQNNTSSAPQPGMEATQITVTLTSSCTVYAFHR